MTAAIIDYEKIKKVKDYAEKNIIPLAEIMEIYHGKAKIIGDREDYC
ncbi:MAG: hypothetical protein H0X03_05710, partial [Nitrosopumilus sp.]|nr:hypothetical protein [Nitrosopumilus sp.]